MSATQERRDPKYKAESREFWKQFFSKCRDPIHVAGHGMRCWCGEIHTGSNRKVDEVAHYQR